MYEAGLTPEGSAELLTRTGRGVSLLEFFAVSEEGPGAIGEDVADRSTGEAELAAEEGARTAAMEAARAEGAAEARLSVEGEMETRLAEERSRVDRVCGQFARDRERYFAAAEAQVVGLALAAARRVLAREIAADPMHLADAVRSALGRVHDGSATVLRVRREEVEAWNGVVGGSGVEVVGDEGLAMGECVLETTVGRVELGVEVQLEEIERGFGELLHRQGV